MAVYQNLSVAQVSQNQQANTSQVRILWQSTQTGGSFNDTRRTARYQIRYNAEPSEKYTVTYTLPMQSTATILDITVTVPHDSKGEASVEVFTWMNTNISAGVVELSQKLYLDTIPQAGTLLATDGVIGGISRLAISKKSAEHTHSIFYAFGNLSGFIDENGQVQAQEHRFSRDSLDFLIPHSFYGQIPQAKSGKCQLTLQTYLHDTPVGEPHAAEFTAAAAESDCLPGVVGSVVDVNDETVALTGDETVLIPFGSVALCTIQSTAKNGAVITKEWIAGEEVEDHRLTVSNPQMRNVSFSAEDSRGYKTQVTVPVTVIAYEKPQFEAAIHRTDPVSGSAQLSLSGRCYAGSFGKENNSLSVAYSVNGTDFVPVEAVEISENRFTATACLENMEYSRVYTVTVRVADRLFTEQKQTVLKKTLPVFDWGEQDFSFHVPVGMDSPLSLQSGGTGTATLESGLVIKKQEAASLSAIPTAPGALYVSEPNALPQFGLLPVSQGGTGGESPEQACENLGIVLPMEVGEEYATYRRWMGKTVYTKIVEYGQLPNTAAKAVPHGAAANQILECRGTMSCGKSLPWGGIHAYRADLFCDKESIYIDTEKDYSDQTAVVQIWYTK